MNAMKIKNFSLLLVIGGSLTLSSAIFSSCASKNKLESSSNRESSSLAGIWQICHKVPSQTSVSAQIYKGKTLKILSEDGKFTNVYFDDKRGGAIITGYGTYRQTSDNMYIESIVNSVNTSINNDEIEFLFKIVDNKSLHTRFFVKKDGRGNPLNRWFEESYVKVIPVNYDSFLTKMTKLNSSQKKHKLDKDDDIWPHYETAPVFTGGGKVTEWVASRLRYPVEALKDKIEGRVYIKFVIEADGSVTNVEIMRGITEALDTEAIRVVKTMPKWKPGKFKDKFVRCSYQMPINFRLSSPMKK